MSDKNQDFWKELMGEDFKVDLHLDDPLQEKPADEVPPPETAKSAPAFTDAALDPDDPAPETPADEVPPPETAKSGSGFTIEYVAADGTAIRPPEHRPASHEPAREPAESETVAFEPVKKSAEPELIFPEPVQEPEGPELIAHEPAKKPAEPELIIPEPVQEPEGPEPVVHEPAKTSDAPKPAAPSPAPWIAETQRSVRPDRAVRRKDASREKFEVEFDFDAEYPDVNEKTLRRARTKRTGCLSGILLFFFVISVSAVLAFLGWTWATDVLGLDGGEEFVEVTLPRDIFHTETRTETNSDGDEVEVTVSVADMDAVAEELYQKGLIRYKWLFKLFSRFAHGDIKVHAGTYNLKMNYDYRALINGMNPRTGHRNTVKVTIPEGYTITQIAALMEENKVCATEDFLDAVANSEFDFDFLEETTPGDPKRLEGFLFPDTYEFYENDDPDSVIKRFLNNFDRKWTDDFAKKAQEMGYSVRDIVNIASMIEKEAGADSERGNIASVIYNRLADVSGTHGTNTYLQIDATIRYVIADTGENFSTLLDSPYNTYMYPGLPVGPIANPGLASIRAALNPSSTKYYYYALGKTGTHRFFETYEAFSRFVNSDEYGG